MDATTVTNQQLYLAIGVPMLFNVFILTVFVMFMNAKLDGMNARFEGKFDAVTARLDAVERRLDELKELWRAELRRVEEVLDARLKHLESR